VSSSTFLAMTRWACPPFPCHAGPFPSVVAVPFDWPIFLGRLPDVPPFFAEFAPVPAAVIQPDARAAQLLKPGRLAASPRSAGARRAEIAERVQAVVADALGRRAALSEPLMAAGLDSLGAAEMRNALQALTHVALPATVVFDYPTTQVGLGLHMDFCRP
jgi:Phosphopantetheine attachment site